MIQGLQLDMSIVPDHIGGPFTQEEKEFMIQTALLEHKWRVGKRKQAEIDSLRGTRESVTGRLSLFMPVETARVDKVHKVKQASNNETGRFCLSDSKR